MLFALNNVEFVYLAGFLFALAAAVAFFTIQPASRMVIGLAFLAFALCAICLAPIVNP